MLGDVIAEAKRSSSSRIRIRPPSEVTRDPWKSTFNEADAAEHPKIRKWSSKWKCGGIRYVRFVTFLVVMSVVAVSTNIDFI